MNAAKYIRYILTIATALLFFSACKDDKNESQPTDFILRVDESVSIKLPNSTVKTEETAGLQVSCEPGMDITGSPTDKSTRSYGFTYVETGKLLRFSAQGDFSQKGILNNGIMATRDNDNTPIQYEACTVSIEKVNDAGKIWFTLQFTDRSDIRIVTEIF